MENNVETRGSFKGLIPFIVFILLYLGTGIFLHIAGVELAFYQLPGPVAAFAGIVVAFIIFNGSIQEKFNTFLEGCGHPDIITMCIIYLLAGAFAIVSKAMGGVDSTVNFGITYIPPHYIAVGLFIIGAFISTATGTSVGAIVALGPIAVGLGEKSGVPMPLILAAVMGGAMFGDNLSVISDTTIAATRTQEVEMKDKFRVNFLIVLPAVILNIVVLSFIGGEGVEGAVYEYNLLNLVPYVSIIVLALIGINVMIVLTIGVVLGLIIGLFNNSFTFIEIFSVVQRGMGWMENMAIIALVVGGVVAIMEYLGGIDYLLENLTEKIKSKKGAEFGISILVSLLCLATTNNTVSIITAGPLAKDIADKFSVDRRRVAGLLDIFSSGFQGLMPYAGQILVAAAMAQISPVSIVPYSWYSMFMIIMGTLAIIIGIPKFKEKN